MVPKQVVSRRDVPAEFVADFVNTRADGGGHVELFGSPDDLRAWAVRRELLAADAVVTDSDVVAAHELREALRRVLVIHADGPDAGDERLARAEQHLREAGSRYPLSAYVTADGARLRARDSGVPGVLANVLAAVVEAAQRGEWSLVKACSSPVCQFAFVDRTRNHSGRYCCAGCASRVSMRAHRARQRKASTD